MKSPRTRRRGHSRTYLVCRFLPIIGRNDSYEDGPRGILAVFFDEETGHHYSRPASIDEYVEATKEMTGKNWRRP